MSNQVFTSSGTFTWPDGVTSALIECRAGGAPGYPDTGSGAGGGGAYSADTISRGGVSSDSVTVASVATGTNNGNPSYFRDSGTVYADYGRIGSGTTGGVGGSTANCIGSTKFNGGAGADGDGSSFGGGGGGGGAGDAADGGSGSGTTAGTGGSAGGGDGGAGNSTVDGVAPGGGGCGRYGGSTGSGARGEVSVTWTAGHLTITAQPTTTKSGATIITLTVEVRDSGQTVDTNASGTVTVSFGNNAGGGTLSGTLTRSPSSGVYTFNDLSIDKFGSGYTLTFTHSDAGTVTTSTFNITGDHLAFNVQPSNTRAGATITPAVKVELLDTTGVRDTNASNSITLAIGTNPASGTLSGTNPVSLSSGLATFSDLSINNAGTGYTLTAAATGITGATSSSFDITGITIDDDYFPPRTIPNTATPRAALSQLAHETIEFVQPLFHDEGAVLFVTREEW